MTNAQEYEATVLYPEEVLKETAKCLWKKRRFKKVDFVIVIALGIQCAYAIITKQEGSPLAVILAFIGIISVLWLIRRYAYWRTLARMRSHFGGIPGNRMTFTFRQDAIRSSAGSAESVLCWKDIVKVWSSSRVLLVFANDRHYLLLPISQLREEITAFVARRIREEYRGRAILELP